VFVLNQIGQAYSTFKLLIAAIVAVAILYILMSIIGIIPTIGGDIQTVTKQMVQKQAGMLGALDTSSPVSFNAGSNLAPSALVGNSGLSANQICINKGDMIENENLQVQGQTIANNGRTNLQVKVSVTCNLTKSLNDSLEEMGFELDWGDDDGNCECDLDDEDATQKCCAVILRFA
jgi:hypothetical protein